MQDDKKERLQQLLRAKREAQFEKVWNAAASEYSSARETAEFMLRHGAHRPELLPLPSIELSGLIKLLSKEFYLGRTSVNLGKGESFVESYVAYHGLDLSHLYTWCKQSGISSDGQLLGLLLDVLGGAKRSALRSMIFS
ncbi:hypothetical protein [Pseudoduganella chitinolytica]|uniref:Uncharacterized protein n=1 Tax=Pseudoduganella chitinolytica TaxID=34070 RepID=A0ABY8BBU8_9BURK|nr:hypothetical protein [Pseudoduganella chitinolytica]WEF33191.1 hypothetical protein PX653_28035 [Pseudoduganella chitinolytica]